MIKELDSVITIVDSLLHIKEELDQQAENSEGPDIAKRLSIKYLSLASTMNEVLKEANKILRSFQSKLRIRYAIVLNHSEEKSEAAKKRVAESDEEYLNIKEKIAYIQDYCSYLMRLREDLYAAHVTFRIIYKNEVELYLGTDNSEE